MHEEIFAMEKMIADIGIFIAFVLSSAELYIQTFRIANRMKSADISLYSVGIRTVGMLLFLNKVWNLHDPAMITGQVMLILFFFLFTGYVLKYHSQTKPQLST